MRKEVKRYASLHFILFLIIVFSAASATSAQTNESVDLSGEYVGNLKFPSANLNGKATLSVEGDKFVLRSTNGGERGGRITAVKTGDDFVSVALVLDEKPTEKQPFSHSIISLRFRKNGNNLAFINAPGEARDFHFEAAPQSTAQAKNFNDVRLVNSAATECADPAVKCPISFGQVSAAELEKAAAPKPVFISNSESKSNRAKTAARSKNALRNKAAATSLKAAKTTKNPATPETVKTDSPIPDEKQTSLPAKQENESDASAIKDATNEMRRATVELRRANDEVHAATNELHRLRTEKSVAPTTMANPEKVEKSTKKTESVAPAKITNASSNKSSRKKAVSPKTAVVKTSKAKSKSVKSASTKPKAKKSAASKRRTPVKQTAPVKKSQPEKNTKPAETKASPSPTPLTSPSPAKSPNQNANNANVGKSSE